MSNGVPHPLSDFSWNSSQTDSVQRANVQNAFDSGEPLWWPVNEPVTIDNVGLDINFPSHIVGHGGDATIGGFAPSKLVMMVSASDVASALRIKSHNVTLESFDVAVNVIGPSSGIVVGDSSPTGPDPFGVLLRRMSTGANFHNGIVMLSGQHLVAELCTVNCWGGDAFQMNNRNSDEGDNQIVGGRYAGWGGQAGLEPNCIHLLSGGGLTITPGTKLLDSFCHVKVDWFTGGSGGFQLLGASLENCHGPISVDMNGSKPFTRAIILGNSFGNGSCAIAVRNFGDGGVWLQNLVVGHNGVDVGQANPCMDFGRVGILNVDGNGMNGGNIAAAGIVIRNPAEGAIGINTIRNIAGGSANYIVHPDADTLVTQPPFSS